MKSKRRQPGRKRDPSRQKPTVAIIGVGRVGTALAIALSKVGYRINLVAGLHGANARRTARLVGRPTVGMALTEIDDSSSSAVQLLASTQLVLISTPDDAVESVASRLSRLFASANVARSQEPALITMHTSGALTSHVLSPLKQHDHHIGSIHPLISISDARTGVSKIRGAFFALEGEKLAVRMGKQIVRDLGGQSFTIAPEKKALYHAGALMASPNMTALFDIAVAMVADCGLSPRRAREVLLPLLRSTVDNLARNDPEQALTGTFKRGDIETIRKHLAAIEVAGLKDALAAYVLLGRRALRLTNIDKPRRREIERLLFRETMKPGLSAE